MFARAPVPGRTKTRLVPLLGDEGAALLHGCMLLDTLERVRAAGFEPIVFLSPLREEARLRRMGVDAAVEGQGGGGLGVRMTRALSTLTSARAVDRAFLIGTDSPDLPTALLQRAARELARSRVVLAPAQDGGFTIIGMQRGVDLSALLSGIQWSRPDTLRRTVERMNRAGLSPRLLDVWWDVDEPSDVQLLEHRIATARALGHPVPARTAAYLDALRVAGRALAR